MKKLIIPLLLLLMVFAAGCVPGGPISITTSNQLPVINSFGAGTPSISVGESATLSWSVAGATTVSIDQGIGNVALTATRVVSPSATTIYTLTATSSAGSVTATAQVIVSGAPTPMPTPVPTPTPTPTPVPGGMPVVNYFTPNPPVISAGGSTTLSWSVSNATAVDISPGVGAVGLVGTTSVSPAASTNYTLKASNAGSWYSLTITVLVTGAPLPVGEPDLVIQDISRDGDTIRYVIKNQGGAAAGPSTSTLSVDGVVKANDSVGSLAPGESKTESFGGYTYACTLPGDDLVVKADTGGAVAEGSEANNSFSKSWSCLVVYIPPLIVTLKPDLVIEDIWLVHEITGDKIYYRIKNNGVVASGASTSALRIYPCIMPCLPVAIDSVASLAAGESRTEKFTAYNYTGIGVNVAVKANEGGAITESDETNNSLSKPKTDL